MSRQYHWLILSREYSYSRTTNLKRTVPPRFHPIITHVRAVKVRKGPKHKALKVQKYTVLL